MAGGVLWFPVKFLVQFIGKQIQSGGLVKGTPANSDAPAPTGLAGYVKMVEACCPTASPETRLDYVRQGLTEAQVLRAEVVRLGAVK
jgi:hypothetical protein